MDHYNILVGAFPENCRLIEVCPIVSVNNWKYRKNKKRFTLDEINSLLNSKLGFKVDFMFKYIYKDVILCQYDRVEFKKTELK